MPIVTEPVPPRGPLRRVGAAIVLLTSLVLVRAVLPPAAAWGGPADPGQATAAPDSGAVPPADSATSKATPHALPEASKAFGHLETGRTLYENTCLPCHGSKAEGNRDIGAPALNRQEPWYLLAQLRKFRSGLRGTKDDDIGGQMMAPMAKSLEDEQALLDVATYVSSLASTAPPSTLKGDRAAGERTFRSICVPCHGPMGSGRPEIRTPALLGQADWYIVSQLRKFRRGVRGYHEADVAGMQMRGMAAALASEKAVIDVAVFIASLAQ